MTAIIFAAILAIALGLICAIILVLADKFMSVPVDERFPKVRECLPGANCGACGYAGCDAFASALVKGEASLDSCGATSKANKIEICNILGKTYLGADDTIAVVSCNGGVNCVDKFDYQGYGDCISQEILAKGRKECAVGCMGAGSCVDVCPNLAIECYDGYAHVDKDLCTSCGLCIKACPKKLIKRIPKSAKIYVACSTQCKGKEVMNMCKTGCISCGLCQKVCKYDAIHLVNNVPIIDYSKCVACMACYNKCPRKVIKVLEKQSKPN